MKRYAIFVLVVFYTCILTAQSLTTIVVSDFTEKDFMNIPFDFHEGDTVTILGYKRLVANGGAYKYYFAIERGDFAKVIERKDIPFDVTEKKLKKLPDAFSQNVEKGFNNKNKIIESKRTKEEYKFKAINGELKFVLKDIGLYSLATGAKINALKGDTICIVGYDQKGTNRRYALFSEKEADIYESFSDILYTEGHIKDRLLPSVDDIDVKITIKQKQNELKSTREEYRNKALKGEILGVIDKDVEIYYKDSNMDAIFHSGDTVSILGYSVEGYSQTNMKKFYALYSSKDVGVFWTRNNINPFKNSENIKFCAFPAVNDKDVQNILIEKKTEIDRRRQEIADSLDIVRLNKKLDELKESKMSLIETLREKDPIMVSVDSWTSNSVGLIKVNLSVINCDANQTIKYITFQGYFTNPVGDKVRNEIGGGTIWKGRGVGPIGPRPTTLDNFDERFDDFEAKYDFDNQRFYSQTASYFHMSSITIQYMNGRTITLTGEKLKKHVVYN